MNKSFYILLFFLIIINRLKAQEIDKEILECQYKFSWVSNTAHRNVVKEDFMILKVGNKVSDFYSFNTFRVDSLIQADTKRGLSAMEILGKRGSYGKRGMEYHIFKNFPVGKTTVTEKVVADYFKYEEPLNQEWKITKEKANMNGYPAQKATCIFSGRQYTAWFTTEVPIATGPWKFYGLPGLILEVEDKSGDFKFQMVGLHRVSNGEVIKMQERPYQSTTKKAFLKLEEKYKKDPVAYITANTSAQITPTGNNQVKVRPYNPIEL